MCSASIVTYHYVRPLERTRFRRVKARDLDEFCRQIAYLKNTSTIISLDVLLDAIVSGSDLPERATVLTFDDGFADHYDYVVPVLHDAGLTGTFFPPARPVLDRFLLDVHRIQFILASLSKVEKATEIVDTHVRENSEACESVEVYRNRFFRAGRFDDPETNYLKKMLQMGLPESVRSALCTELFAKFVSVDETAFAEELYVSEAQLRLMQNVGMQIGSHGTNHVRLATCSEEEQTKELMESLDFLRALGVREGSGYILCYPYGSYDERTERIARLMGFRAAVTTESRFIDVRTDSLFRLPRLDTNEVPIG